MNWEVSAHCGRLLFKVDGSLSNTTSRSKKGCRDCCERGGKLVWSSLVTPLTNQGRNFESAVFSEMCRLLGIEKTPLHPQSDGMVERFNRTLEAQLSKFASDHQKDWDEYVPLLMMAYRTAIHETSCNTPANLMLGHDLRLSVDLLTGDKPITQTSDYVLNLQEWLEKVYNFAKNNLRLKSDKMKEYHDAKSTG